MTSPSSPTDGDLSSTTPVFKNVGCASSRCEPPLPDRLGRYKVLQCLGSGGFATVLLADDEQLGRQVAIKIPRRDRFPSAESVQQFVEEARTAARLQHPGIVAVFDVGTEHDTPFIVLEYIRGRTLSHLLQHENLSWPAAARMVMEIAEALAHAHERGFVHRDIKPQNILLDGEDRAHIADFGLAVSLSQMGPEDREVVGTAMYMAPEQVRGENHRIDARTDIWGVGIIMYRILTGRLPFPGSSAEDVAEAILYGTLTSLRQIDPSIPAELERVCLRCLCRQMSERYRSASDLADDLLQWLRQNGGELSGSSRRRAVAIAPPDSRVIPRGLRCFEQEDADFFLKLIPGPRDRDGLPIVLRFWKQRIEDQEADRTFRIGVLYGPSGCGKSSLLKAGLLPRLSPDIVPIYLDTTSRDTESRLRRALYRKFPDLPQDQTLAETLRLLRERSDYRGGRKALIILDQFEQWLDSWSSGPDADLIAALRHCDGGQVQCLLLVRDDFWLLVSRFMRLLEVVIIDGVNGMLVDSFDSAHARRVLREFGMAYGRMPDKAADETDEQRVFVDRAVAELAEQNRLSPVRLAVFVEMLKDRSWVPGTLDAMGGAAGVGTAFLEGSIGSQASRARRQHERAARDVLAALMPPTGQIKGGLRSRSELLRISGYAEHPEEFSELMRLLDVELRLLTPAPQSEEDSSPDIAAGGDAIGSAETVYYLTHDFLVPSIREWLHRQMRETSQGRAQLMLQEQAELWGTRRLPRYLPSLGEWIGLCLRTRRRDWTEGQARMMRVAGARIARRTLFIAGVLVLGLLAAWTARQSLERRSNLARANLLFGRLQEVQVAELPGVIRSMDPYWRLLEPRLQQLAADPAATMRERIRAAVALLPRDESPVGWLQERLVSEETPPDDFLVASQALRLRASDLSRHLHESLQDVTLSPRSRFRASCALAGIDPESSVWTDLGPEVAASLLSEPVANAPVWIDTLRPVARHLRAPLMRGFEKTNSLEAARVGAVAVYMLDNEHPGGLIKGLLNCSDCQYRAIVELLRRRPDNSKQQLQEQLQTLEGDAQPMADMELRAQIVANLILALFELGDRSALREHLQVRSDPRLRTRLIYGMSPERMDLATLVALILEPIEDPPLFVAALLGAWSHRDQALSADLQGRLRGRLVEAYRQNPDGEAHAAAGLLLRQMCNEDLGEIDRQLMQGGESPSRRWFVNSAGQTMIVLDPPAFRLDGYTPPPALGRFAICATEATRDQMRTFVPNYVPDPNSPESAGDAPAVSVHLMLISAYCNELSRRDGIPEDQWCYPQGPELSLTHCDPLPDFNKKTGYRLPTSAEWEFACRCGSTTLRFTGDDEELLRFYAWDRIRSEGKPQRVAQLLPNPFGLFDIFGNAAEVCIAETKSSDNRPIVYGRRGQSCITLWTAMTSDSEIEYDRRFLLTYLGFRVVRTIASPSGVCLSAYPHSRSNRTEHLRFPFPDL